MSAALALLSSLFWGTSDYLGGAASRRLPARTVLFASQLVALLGLVPVAIIAGELGAPRGYLVPGVIAGLVGMVALGSFYRALSTGTMGVVAPIAGLGVVVPVAVGLLQGESPSSLQLAGIGVAIVGVVLLSGPELSGRAGSGPLVLAAVAAVGFGTVLTLVAEGSDEDGSVAMLLLTMRCTSVVLLLGVALVLGGGVLRRATPSDAPLMVTIGAFDVAANGTYAIASRSALVSVTVVLASLYPVVTAVLARRLDHERLRPIQIVGVGAAVAGVCLLAAG